jgi:hypothetical protein
MGFENSTLTSRLKQRELELKLAQQEVRLLKMERRIPAANLVSQAKKENCSPGGPACKEYQGKAVALLRALAGCFASADAGEAELKAHIMAVEDLFRGAPPFGCVKKMMRCDVDDHIGSPGKRAATIGRALLAGGLAEDALLQVVTNRQNFVEHLKCAPPHSTVALPAPPRRGDTRHVPQVQLPRAQAAEQRGPGGDGRPGPHE